jgi:hypothetical protein
MLAKNMRRKICLDKQIDTADISSLLTFPQSTERERERGSGGGGGGLERERGEKEREVSCKEAVSTLLLTKLLLTKLLLTKLLLTNLRCY